MQGEGGVEEGKRDGWSGGGEGKRERKWKMRRKRKTVQILVDTSTYDCEIMYTKCLS